MNVDLYKKFRELYVQDGAFRKFPQLPEMKILTKYSYYDGAMSGLCLIDGVKYYFKWLEDWKGDWPDDDDDFKPPWFRRYLIWKLEDSLLTILEEYDKVKEWRFSTPPGVEIFPEENQILGWYEVPW